MQIYPLISTAEVIIITPSAREIVADGNARDHDQDWIIKSFEDTGTFNDTVESIDGTGTAISHIKSNLNENGILVDIELIAISNNRNCAADSYAAAGTTLPINGENNLTFEVTEPTIARVESEFDFNTPSNNIFNTVVVALSPVPARNNLIFRGWGNVTQTNWEPDELLDESVILEPGQKYPFRWVAQIYSHRPGFCNSATTTLNLSANLSLISQSRTASRKIPLLTSQWTIVFFLSLCIIAFVVRSRINRN